MRHATQADPVNPVPPAALVDVPALTDDECLVRLALAIEQHDSRRLDEVARLIGRLAAIIE